MPGGHSDAFAARCCASRCSAVSRARRSCRSRFSRFRRSRERERDDERCGGGEYRRSRPRAAELVDLLRVAAGRRRRRRRRSAVVAVAVVAAAVAAVAVVRAAAVIAVVAAAAVLSLQVGVSVVAAAVAVAVVVPPIARRRGRAPPPRRRRAAAAARRRARARHRREICAVARRCRRRSAAGASLFAAFRACDAHLKRFKHVVKRRRGGRRHEARRGHMGPQRAVPEAYQLAYDHNLAGAERRLVADACGHVPSGRAAGSRRGLFDLGDDHLHARRHRIAPRFRTPAELWLRGDGGTFDETGDFVRNMVGAFHLSVRMQLTCVPSSVRTSSPARARANRPVHGGGAANRARLTRDARVYASCAAISANRARARR